MVTVALRKESVDRNQSLTTNAFHNFESLSARRAWIEIVLLLAAHPPGRVALRKESVDRNHRSCLAFLAGFRRSPQGERG